MCATPITAGTVPPVATPTPTHIKEFTAPIPVIACDKTLLSETSVAKADAPHQNLASFFFKSILPDVKNENDKIIANNRITVVIFLENIIYKNLKIENYF